MQLDATLAVGLIAAATALAGYLLNSAAARRSERARRYADALDAVERYRQLPYTFLRLHDETPQTRAHLAAALGEAQASLAFHRRRLTLDSREVGAAYDSLVDKIRERNSEFRRDALSRPPSSSDVQIEVGYPYNFDDKREREECFRVMRKHLTLWTNLA